MWNFKDSITTLYILSCKGTNKPQLLGAPRKQTTKSVNRDKIEEVTARLAATNDDT